MKLIEVVTVPKKTVERVIGHVCDFPDCRKPTDATGIYEVEEVDVRVEVKHRSGESYPAEGWGTLVEIDICPTCFKEKLIPWLKSQGVRIEPTEWEW